MHQDYDKIFKENIKKAEKTVLDCICGIQGLQLEELPRDVPRTIERRGDWLKIGLDPHTNSRKLYHIEFQTANEDTMPLRMLIYWSLYRERYKLPVEQFVVYLGESPLTMPNTLQDENVWFRYSIIAINSIDYELFLSSDTPEGMILAILADFKKQDNLAVIGKILAALTEKIKNKRKLQKYIFQMELLANLRNLQPLISYQITNMSINYDLSKDFRFNQGIDLGISQGIDLGISQGIDLGISQGEHNIAKTMVRTSLAKGLTIEFIAELLQKPITYIQTIQAEIEQEKA
jgi:predicted transposase/invertase (TIGR01784 family)